MITKPNNYNGLSENIGNGPAQRLKEAIRRRQYEAANEPLTLEIVETGVNPERLPSANMIQYLTENMNFVKGSGPTTSPSEAKSKFEAAWMFDTPNGPLLT